MKTYSGDPYWLIAKFDSTSTNGLPVKRGDRVFYFPRTRAIYNGERAQLEASQFAAAAQDEAVYQGRDY